MPDSTNSLTLQLLAWIASGRRTYGETMDAWRSTCPRLTVWEDAVGEGLVRVQRGRFATDSIVDLTPRGRRVLEESAGR